MWHLIGITHAEPMAAHDEKHFAHATAPALHGPWTKQPFALSTDPDAGETHLWAPHVIAHDDRYWMFYCGGGSDETAYRIQLAVSDDCWSWTRHSANPLVVDGFHARDPMVLRLPDRWVLYYTATSDAGRRALRRQGGRVRRPRHVARAQDRVHRRARRNVRRNDRVTVRRRARRSLLPLHRSGLGDERDGVPHHPRPRRVTIRSTSRPSTASRPSRRTRPRSSSTSAATPG